MNVVLIGYGAIGQAIHRRLEGSASVALTHVVVREQRLAEVQATLIAAGSTVQAVTAVPKTALLVEPFEGRTTMPTLGVHLPLLQWPGVDCQPLEQMLGEGLHGVERHLALADLG